MTGGLFRRSGGARPSSWVAAGVWLATAACAPETTTFRTVAFPSADGLEITADLYEGVARETPTVVLFHQSQSSRGEFGSIGPRLQQLGYNVVAVDLRWGGAWEGVTNETALRNGTAEIVARLEEGADGPWPAIDASYDDMVASLNWLDGQGYVGPRFVLGSSFSAMLVYRLGAEEDVAAVMAFSPAEYDEARPELVRSWAHALHAPVLSFAAAGEEEMVSEVADAVSVEGSLYLAGSVEGHGASILMSDPEAWTAMTSFLAHHTGGPPDREVHRVVSPTGVPVFVDRYFASANGPVVSLFHQGGGSARGEYGFLIPRLLELGLNVVAADLQGGGERFGFPNRTLRETPQPSDFHYCDALPQARAVLDSARAWYPESRHVVWGSSYSGALVLHAVADGYAVDRVLAFSPASGEVMGDCSANLVADQVSVSLLLLRPQGEAGIPSVMHQLAVFSAAGHRVSVVSPGVHGSSMLNAVRVGADAGATWSWVMRFLTEDGHEGRATAGGGFDVWTDGSFGEWEGAWPVAVDGTGDVSRDAAMDLRTARGVLDDRYLHLEVDVGRPVTLQGFQGQFEMVLDSDGDMATGAGEEGYEGAEAVVVFSPPGGPGVVVGSGVAARLASAGSLGALEPAGRMGVLASPTHSSDRFEVRLSRGGMLRSGGGNDVLGVRLRFREEGEIRDELGPFVVAKSGLAGADASSPPTLNADSVRREDGDFRVLVWNVSDGQFRREAAAFQRVLAALDADVVLLDEVPGSTTAEQLTGFFSGVEDGDEWEWWLAEGGGPQRTVVASPRWGVEGEPRLAHVPYPPGAIEDWILESDSAELALARQALEREGGLSATGAWVEVAGRRFLFVPMDFQSAGFDGSPRDRLRELQARTLREAVADVLAANPDAGLVIGGDLNLVGSQRPLRALAEGLGPGGAPLSVATPLNRMDRSLITWRSLGNADQFSPGRLDYVLYRPGPVRVVRSFVFDADDLEAEDLGALGLLGGETAVTSDHLPVVVDFRVEGPE